MRLGIFWTNFEKIDPLKKSADFEAYKKNLYSILNEKLNAKILSYKVEDFPVKIGRLQADLATNFPLDANDSNVGRNQQFCSEKHILEVLQKLTEGKKMQNFNSQWLL